MSLEKGYEDDVKRIWNQQFHRVENNFHVKNIKNNCYHGQAMTSDHDE